MVFIRWYPPGDSHWRFHAAHASTKRWYEQGVRQATRRSHPHEITRPTLLTPESTSFGVHEHKQGLRCFHQCVTVVVFLRRTFRFRDRITGKPCPVLPKLLEYMRAPGGQPMPAHLWQALQKCLVRNQDDPRLLEPRRLAGYTAAVNWVAVTRLMHLRALREARERGQILMFAQAVDKANTHMEKSEYLHALLYPNMNETGSRMALLPTYIGMKMRLTKKLNAVDGIVQGAFGEVLDVIFHPREFEDEHGNSVNDWRKDPGLVRDGVVCLQRLPEAVLVNFEHRQIRDVHMGFGKGVVAICPGKPEKWRRACSRETRVRIARARRSA